MSQDNSGQWSEQVADLDPGLFSAMNAMSLEPDLPWESIFPSGNPWSIITVCGGAYKGFYFCLDDTDGALRDVADDVEDVESSQLEHTMSASIGRVPINGWRRSHWNNIKIIGQPRVSRVTNTWLTPVHLRYAFSTDGSVYCIKKAATQDAYERVQYPFALSNLIGMTIRQHRLNTPKAPLRHIVFYNVENQQAWGAICLAFAAAGVSLPELPQKSMMKEEEEEMESKRSRQSRRSSHKGKGKSSKPIRRQIPSVWVTITPSDPAWGQLHNNNPFTKVLTQVRASECEVGLPSVAAFTLIAVPQERWSAEQTYWSALIAHLDVPAEAPAVKGKGKLIQVDNSAPSSSRMRHALR